MKHVKVLSALGLLAMAGAANAGVTSTWTLTNDYDFRGFSQSATDPALQASLDYAHDSGFYAGLWFSNVKFASSASGGLKGDLERDIYAGFTNKIGESLTYDVGAVYYTYNQHELDFAEIYGSLAFGPVKAKLFYSPDFGGDTTAGNTKAYAATVDATIPLPANFSLLAHVGHNWGSDYWADAYNDYFAGVGYTAGKFNLALKYVGSDADEITSDYFNNEDRVIFSVATTFPW